MASILIDGYNLIGIAHKDIDKARNSLIDNLSEYSRKRHHNITVVFDGWRNGRAEETITWRGGIRVIYSRIGEKADNVIMRLVLNEKRQWIVISSDREIADFVTSQGLVSIRVEEFEEKLYRAVQDYDEEDIKRPEYNYKDEEGDYAIPCRKGPSRRLSKRDKKRLQALKKL